MYVRPFQLNRFLSTYSLNNDNNSINQYDSKMLDYPKIIGHIISSKTDSKWMTVKRKPHGRNSEWNYHRPQYPPFPVGATGYFINFPVMKYISDNSQNLKLYANEDATMGIWMDQINPTIGNSKYQAFRDNFRFYHTENLQSQAYCDQGNKKSYIHNVVILGHRYNDKTLEFCYKYDLKRKLTVQHHQKYVKGIEVTLLPYEQLGDSKV